MRICVDATSLLLRSAGVKNYVYHWIRAMQRDAPEHNIIAFPMLDAAGELNHEASTLSLLQTLPRIALLHLMNLPHHPGMDYLMSKVDVFHASNQVHNPPKRTRLTGTLYDMTCFLMPQNHTAGNIRAERNFANRILSRAHGLIAISNHTRLDAVNVLGLNPDKIAVIYPGVPQSFFEVTPNQTADAKTKYSLAKPYILFVGTVEPRKNLDLLLDAYEALPGSLREEFDLIAVGPVGWAAGSTVQRLASGVPGVRHLGYVPEVDLPGITAGASVFVYPSLYEGFGFPVAQSMAAGVPVITSNVSSLPEVARDAAILVDPKSQSELRDALERLLTSPGLQTQLGLRGAEISKEYTWKVAARRSADFFSNLP
ncbi:MAG: glycosyltransferase family 1 protein [Bryobacteraceae bacterium]